MSTGLKNTEFETIRQILANGDSEIHCKLTKRMLFKCKKIRYEYLRHSKIKPLIGCLLAK